MNFPDDGFTLTYYYGIKLCLFIVGYKHLINIHMYLWANHTHQSFEIIFSRLKLHHYKM